MKTPLLIIGAGNVGGFIAYNIDEFGQDFEILGFLDDAPEKLGKTLYGYQVLGKIENCDKYKGQGVAIAIGIANPKIKRRIANALSGLGFHYPKFISKHSWISNKVEIGKGVIVYPGVAINYETTLGDFVIMNMNCSIGHNCIVSSYSSLAPGVNLAGFTYIEEAVDVGIGASTRQDVRIGNDSVIGGQAMITKNVPADSLVVGVPGEKIN